MTRSTRRQFLKTTAAAATASVAAPMFLNASDKAGSKTPVVGRGEYTFECHHGWGELPDGHSYGNASHGVTVGEDGTVYITHQGTPGSIFVFDADGTFVRSMGKEHFRGSGKGHGIDLRKEGSEEFLYLSPSDAQLAFTKMTTKGEVVWTRGKKELHADSDVYQPKVGYRPTNTSFRPDGGYYLGDGYGSSTVFEYDANDKFVRTLGGRGAKDGQFNTPHGQWLDDRDGEPKLVVADRANKRLQWFDLDGNHVRTQGGFLFPADIDLQGDVLLVPDLHARITLLGPKNEVLAQLGDDEEWRAQALANRFAMRGKPASWKPGRFVHPHDACFTADGDILCVEWVRTGRVTMLKKV